MKVVCLKSDIRKEASVAGEQGRRVGSLGLCHARQCDHRPIRWIRWRFLATSSRRNPSSPGSERKGRGKNIFIIFNLKSLLINQNYSLNPSIKFFLIKLNFKFNSYAKKSTWYQDSRIIYK